MVQSKDATVADWFAEADPKWRPALEAVRASAVRHLGGASERMSYGMPTYVRPAR
jgi:uncharacterized protein YdhG (YjbR/CyaY superfamily)